MSWDRIHLIEAAVLGAITVALGAFIGATSGYGVLLGAAGAAAVFAVVFGFVLLVGLLG